MEEQRRGRAIAMNAEERHEFLAAERTCRVATLDGHGAPHVTALWFIWDGMALWLTSLVRSQRWVDLMRDHRISVLVDAGVEYLELRGVEIRGIATAVGEIPRRGDPVPELETPERLFAAKYTDGVMHHDGRHAWLRVTPTQVRSWDFRKLRASWSPPAVGS